MPRFAPEDFSRRMSAAAAGARDAGLNGVLVAPGPDLVYFTGYAPFAITERLTLLVIGTARDPALIVPILERSDAQNAPGAEACAFIEWTDGEDPYAPCRRDARA